MSNERKKWNESWAKQNDILFHARQELTNAKAANATLSREKAEALKALEEAKEAGARAVKALEKAEEEERRASKALEEANAERRRLDKVVTSLQVCFFNFARYFFLWFVNAYDVNRLLFLTG
ncbi:putative AH/BAR domain superfamily protein [Helianthus anomalus]